MLGVIVMLWELQQDKVVFVQLLVAERVLTVHNVTDTLDVIVVV